MILLRSLFLRDEGATLASEIFLRLLGITYLIAFASLSTQVIGLLGSEGILPVGELLEEVAGQVGARRYLLLPTLCWVSQRDGFLLFLCVSGAALGLALAVLRPGGAVLLLLWIFYLSIVSVGQDFLGFQWDGLLLEAGLLAIFLVPFRLARGRAAPPALVLFLLRFLLFRLMLSSGCVKLTSGDPSWRDLSALSYHFETQPLPNLLAYHAHALPGFVKQALVLIVFAVEIAAPFLLLLPGRWRLAGAIIQVLLQLAIAATGNFAFFNLLTLALCVPVLSDAQLCSLLRLRAVPAPPRAEDVRGLARLPLCFLVLVVLPLALVHLATVFVPRRALPRPVRLAIAALAPFHLSSPYGLFAVMTTSRKEIVIEGSLDGRRFLPYEFRHKPGDIMRRPTQVAPHQPRLDWQMWFAALGPVEQSPWFMGLCLRLLEGRPAVLSLLASNPFSGSKPRYLRSLLYEYHFTSPAERRRSGAYWRRGAPTPYTGVLSLDRRQPGG